MTMKSIIFNQHQVNYALKNEEGMFRVVCKKQPKENLGYIREASITGNGYYFPFGKPKFQVGETIFVKESFSKLLIHSGHQYYYPAHCIRECVDRDNGFHYWADGNPEFGDWESPRPATHMKQEYSRLFLRIKSVKVERLNEISKEDIIKEGLPDNRIGQSFMWFQEHWNSTHKKSEEKFEANPWVFVYKYEVIKNN